MIHLGGKLVLARVADALRNLCDELVFVARDSQGDDTPDTAIALRMHVVTDTAPYEGPLAAIHAGLKASVTPLAFIAGADHPFLSRRLIEAMIAAAYSSGPEPESVLARVSGRLHPLHAVLVVNDWVDVVERALAEGQRSPTSLIESVAASDGPPVSVMTEDELQLHDPRLLSFFDIDTPEQLHRARRLIDPRRVNLRGDIRRSGL